MLFFFFNDTATTEIYTLSLHDALPIFKCCDLLERVLGTPIDLTGCDLAFYESPRAGAALLNLSVSGAIAKLQKALGHLTAPPGGRKVGVMEIETVLCKFHSMVNGHYY